MRAFLRKLRHRSWHVVLAGSAFSALVAAYVVVPASVPARYDAQEYGAASSPAAAEEPVFRVTHVPTPQPVRAIYMSQCVVGTPSFRGDLVELIDETELNAVVIDIKDFSGGLAFKTDVPALRDFVSEKCGASDMKEFIGTLHDRNIYVIGRITVFQDPLQTKLHPERAVQKESDRSTWKDYKGLSFIEAGAQEHWKYIVAIAKESYAIGFDELNFDYIRFPSDGPMKDIYYPFSEETITANPKSGKAIVLKNFFAYLAKELKPTGAALSADLFGMTTTNADDLNIGQILEYALPYFDFIAPMVYPSHYPTGFNGWSNPNQHPYEVVHFSMQKASDRLVAASTSPLKLRPWLQDFDYGGNYDVAEVRAQIRATYDAGLDSWMLWAPSNRYTQGALEPAVR